MTEQKIIRVGKYSLAVIIPAKFVRDLGIKPGDKVKIETNIEKSSVHLRFTGAIQLVLPTGEEKKKSFTALS